MANRHFGRVGDVWKHLPLAEILACEAPRRYWETHAGSAFYALSPSMERDYGVYRFWARGRRDEMLGGGGYHRVLASFARAGGPPSHYPGSAYLAIAVLGSRAGYLLADTDTASVASLLREARTRGLAGVRVVRGDGVAEVAQAASELDRDDAAATAVLIDPFYPFADTLGPLTPVDLFCQLAERGFLAMLWYGFDSPVQRDDVHVRVARSLAGSGLLGADAPLWCGEVALARLGEAGCRVQPGTRGCGVLAANLRATTAARCAEVGEALEAIYRDARFPGGEDGALVFTASRFW
jgi:23S rRNA A2030 N6-methylase RlmJ